MQKFKSLVKTLESRIALKNITHIDDVEREIYSVFKGYYVEIIFNNALDYLYSIDVLVSVDMNMEDVKSFSVSYDKESDDYVEIDTN